MFRLWTKHWRRKRIVSSSLPKEWTAILSERFWLWRMLNDSQRDRLLKLTAIFLSEKEVFVPKEVRDPQTAKLLVAASACVMLLGFTDWYCFDRVETVVLKTAPFQQKTSLQNDLGLQTEVWASGVYNSGSLIGLSWPDVERNTSGEHGEQNVVIHEFAHHVDDLDGSLDGAPPVQSRAEANRWQALIRKEMNHLRDTIEAGNPSALSPYGLTNSAEFFAVSCEAYFCSPFALRKQHPELYYQLHTLFKTDPILWNRVSNSPDILSEIQDAPLKASHSIT